MTARTSSIAGLAAVAALVAASPARAGLGDGIRLGSGEGVLHPFVELSLGYDSNVYTIGVDPAGDAIFHVRPGLKLEVPGEFLAIDARAAVEWVQYLGLESEAPDTSGLWGDAGLRLRVNPKGRIAFELTEAFKRSNEVQSLTLVAPAISNYNMLSATVPFTPGGGALVFALGADWALEAYELLGDDVCAAGTCLSDAVADLGYQDVQGRGSVTWRFLPRTQAAFDLGYSQRIPNNEDDSPSIATLRAVAGLSGLVTTQFGMALKAGWAQAMGDANVSGGPDYDTGSWLATVEAEWMPVAGASVKAGYSHSLGTESGNAYAVYTVHRITGAAKYKFAQRYTAALDARYDMVTYEVTGNDSTATVLSIGPSLKAELARWLHGEVGYKFTKRATDFDVADPAAVEPTTFDYDRHAAFARLSVIY